MVRGARSAFRRELELDIVMEIQVEVLVTIDIVVVIVIEIRVVVEGHGVTPRRVAHAGQTPSAMAMTVPV